MNFISFFIKKDLAVNFSSFTFTESNRKSMGMEVNSTESITRPDNSRVFYTAIARGRYDAVASVDTTLLSEPGIYCIFNSGTNRCYIGCSVNVSNRIQTHKRQLSAGNHICRAMLSDYEKTPEKFVFFCIQYVSESKFDLPESIRNNLLYLETQYIKRVPMWTLYNSVVPASLSERLLFLERPRRPEPIKITEIIARLQMSEDSIRSNGFVSSDVLELEKAIEFVQKRTVASGRWPEEKAAIARDYLIELNGLLPNEPDENLLAQGSVIDFFEQSVEPPTALPEVDTTRRWPLWAALAITAGASVPNMVEVTVAIKGSAPTAYALTAVFTAVPALLIAARLRGFLWGISVAGAMGYTAFCNASAVFGGLTALDKGYILQPTVFLEAVTNMLNTDYLTTARAIAAFTALIIGAVEFVAVKNLSR